MKDKIKMLPYQKKVFRQVIRVINQYNICYLAGEVRTGKTLVALNVATRYRETLFVTKKAAIYSIEKDIKAAGLGLNITVINPESIHKYEGNPDLIILDEAHSFGQFPKPALKTKRIRAKWSAKSFLLLSGTPSPESWSQLYHQFWMSLSTPWYKHSNFYSWAKVHVNIRDQYIGSGRPIKNYSDGRQSLIEPVFNRYRVTMTQEDAGFNGTIKEKIHYLPLPPVCLDLIKELRKKRISSGRKIVADSGARLMSLVHQISSGTVIDSKQTREQLSDFKIRYIKKEFKGRKIAIFYQYIAEGNLLEKNFRCTRDPEEFEKRKDLIYVSQVVRGREGTNLQSADALIFFNIGFSATSYFQAIARSQSRLGGDKEVHWIFSKEGIEQKIYATVQGKKNFTLAHFKKEIHKL